ncbi:MAG: hypothetical protein ACNS60_06575 [Candidatus Cyclobacteriaceae bacterium M2_1C_046]
MKGNFWKAAILSGVIAAVVMLMLELILNPLFLGAPVWGPPRMMATIVMGEGVLPPPASFDLGVILVAMLVHFVLSIIYSIIIGAVVRTQNKTSALITGAVFGLVLYLINFYLFTGIFPWFAEARNFVQIAIHIIFGITAAWAFKATWKGELKDPEVPKTKPKTGTTFNI